MTQRQRETLCSAGWEFQGEAQRAAFIPRARDMGCAALSGGSFQPEEGAGFAMDFGPQKRL